MCADDFDSKVNLRVCSSRHSHENNSSLSSPYRHPLHIMAQSDIQKPLLAELFATHALNTRYEDLTPEAIEQAKIFILDTLGVGIAGSSAFGADIVIGTGLNWGKGDEATLWGRSQRGPASIAALANAYQVHCQEYDSVHEAAVLHPLATTMSAAIAYAGI